jgi:enhancing lycopene biosynthesis protein 2
MSKRVGVVLSGCGYRDGSDVAETMLAFLMLDRLGAKVVCIAPDADQRTVVDHLRGTAVEGAARNARVEAARLAPGEVIPLSALDPRSLDALLVPSGHGVATMLSDYVDKGVLCAVDPDLAKAMRALLPAHKPMGFIGLAAVLAARVLGPVAGVRVTLGSKAVVAAKHAAIMGADVRACSIDDVVADEKARVYSTPGLEAEGAHLAQVAKALDKLTRALVSGGSARDRPARPAPVAPVRTNPQYRPQERKQDRPSQPPAPARQATDPIVRPSGSGGPSGRARGSA